MFLEPKGPAWSTSDLLDALGNAHDREILAMACREPIDAQCVIDRTGFPKSTVYRRIHHLEDKGLLERCRGIVRNGHTVDRYRSQLDRIIVDLSEGRVQVTWHQGAPPIHERIWDEGFTGESEATG